MKTKIIGKPEGRAGIWLLDQQTAKDFIGSLDQEYIHNFINSSDAFIGCDYEKKDVLAMIDREDALVALIFPPNFTMKHQFVITTSTTRYGFDVGEIDESKMIEQEPCTANS